jgi:hypothetical protein
MFLPLTYLVLTYILIDKTFIFCISNFFGFGSCLFNFVSALDSLMYLRRNKIFVVIS